jgi:hypothetical protein
MSEKKKREGKKRSSIDGLYFLVLKEKTPQIQQHSQ